MMKLENVVSDDREGNVIVPLRQIRSAALARHGICYLDSMVFGLSSGAEAGRSWWLNRALESRATVQSQRRMVFGANAGRFELLIPRWRAIP